jgi:hypothetical protein
VGWGNILLTVLATSTVTAALLGVLAFLSKSLSPSPLAAQLASAITAVSAVWRRRHSTGGVILVWRLRCDPATAGDGQLRTPMGSGMPAG